MFSFWFSNLIGLICVITIDFLKPLLRLLISQIVPGQVIMLWSTYNREENWKNPPDNLSPSSMVVRKSLHLRCVVYINYLGDTLTLHFSEGSHTLKHWGTDPHSDDLWKIWEWGIYNFKIMIYYSNMKKPCHVYRSVISIKQLPV